MTPALNIATWNLEWQLSTAQAAGIMRERLLATAPDIICITEGYTDVLSDHYRIAAEADYGYPLTPGRRKVMLWSRSPWASIDCTGDPDMPSGRFIAGRTNTPLGEVTVVGVCIPWREAHVRSGRRDRSEWQDHVAYLHGLRSWLAEQPGRVVIVGDFNQRMPRRYTPPHVHQALLDCLGSRFAVATAGPLPPLGSLAIDHVAHTADLRAVNVAALSNVGPAGEQLSDHFGVSVTLAAVE